MAVHVNHANALYGDPEVQQLLALGSRSQALAICTPREINVSRLLAWLLDPTEGHGLGHKALRSLLVQAGRAENAVNLSISDQRFLSPARVHNLALSSLIVKTELDVAGAPSKATKNSRTKRDVLDVAAIDPVMKVCVAVENKYGARESKTQLQRYHSGLAKLFPGYVCIHVFLDHSEATPSHPQWLGVGYGWLSEFLREQEQDTAVSEQVRRVLTEFRQAVQQEDEESATVTLESRLITSVAARHRDALLAMWEVAVVQQTRKELFLQRLTRLSQDGSMEGQARLSLFQLYHRRPEIWRQCKEQASFAPFYAALLKQFADLEDDVKSVNAYYSLQQWSRFIDPKYADEYAFPVGVRVHKLDKNYRVTAYVSLAHVRPDKRVQLVQVAEELRKKAGRHRPKSNANRIEVYRSSLPQEKALQEAIDRLEEFSKCLRAI